ncbi:hypothetical protein BT93_B2164 [Corymbia citriodora subsp. variegata]|nr:hypothetical protein BT93_B2164 [Corymbia citriodora subsp. variegata]
MQQRTTGSSRGPDWGDQFVDVEAQLEAKQRQSFWRRRMEDIGQHRLPISDHDPHDIGKRETAESRFAGKWIHVIPLIVLLCIFILWWFSYPVRVVIKDGRLVGVHQIEISREFNETRGDLALLASASSPGAWTLAALLRPSNFQNFTRTNETEAPKAN